jgi:hypothetical protein
VLHRGREAGVLYETGCCRQHLADLGVEDAAERDGI